MWNTILTIRIQRDGKMQVHYFRYYILIKNDRTRLILNTYYYNWKNTCF